MVKQKFKINKVIREIITTPGAWILGIILAGWKIWVNTSGDFGLLFSGTELANMVLIQSVGYLIVGLIIGWLIQKKLLKIK